MTAQVLYLPFVFGLLALSLLQVVVSLIGHDFVHRVERVASILLLITFAFFSWRAAGSFSWAPYASDYSRYLPEKTPGARIFWMAFLGAFLSSAWVEAIGVLLASRLHIGSAVPLLRAASGGFVLFVFAAGILGTVSANVLNIYTGAISLLTLDVRLSRSAATVVVVALGAVMAYLGARGFSAAYENFLLLISCWVAPWLGVVLVEGTRRRGRDEQDVRPGLYAFLIGLLVLVSMPFMSQALFEGPVARALGGGDLAYYVGLGVAAAVYALSLRAGCQVRPAHGVPR